MLAVQVSYRLPNPSQLRFISHRNLQLVMEGRSRALACTISCHVSVDVPQYR